MPPTLDLTAFEQTLQQDRKTLITKWNWEYLECLDFQKRAVAFVKENPKEEVLIATNHPPCLTYGRGLQKGTTKDLVDTKPEQIISTYPLYKITRGGGLTFHHPGQWIFYPIINLGRSDVTVKKIIYGLLARIKKILTQEFELSGLDCQTELLGLWKDGKKIASMGIAIERFVTFHGVALNIYPDQDFLAEVAKFNPCGLSFSQYTHLAEHTNFQNLLELFHSKFTDYWLQDPLWYH